MTFFYTLLFLRSRQWQSHCAALQLKANFTLSDLNAVQWQEEFIRHLWRCLFLYQPLVVAVLSWIILALLDKPLESILLGSGYAFAVSIVAALLCALAISCAFALPVSFICGLSIALTQGENAALWGFVGTLLALGIGAALFYRLQKTGQSAWFYQLGGSVLAILLTLLLFLGGSGLSWLFGGRSLGFLSLIALTPLGALILWRGYRVWQGGRHRGWLIFGLMLLIIGLTFFSLFSEAQFFRHSPLAQTFLMGVFRGLSNSLIFGFLVVGSYILASKFVDAVTGLSAAIGCYSLVYASVLIVIGNYAALEVLAWGAGALLLGVTFPKWRQGVFYPFQSAWHSLLYAQNWPLHWHSAFWDLEQKYPLPGLDEYIFKHYPHQTQSITDILDALGKEQRARVGPALFLRLDAQRLADCAKLTEITASVAKLHLDAINEPQASFLRSFQRLGQDIAAALRYQSNYYRRLAMSDILERLETLHREILNSQWPEIFAPVAQQWRALLEAFLTRPEAEDSREIQNPYVVGSPLDAQQMTFIGRQEISLQLEELLRKPACPPLLLYGQRRMGKTSLLYNLPRLLPQAVLPLQVDIQGLPAQANNVAEFFTALSREMRRSALHRRGLELPTFQLEENAFFAFDQWLNQLERHVADSKFLLMLDEFISLDDAFDQRRLDRQQLLGFLRHQLQHRPRLKVMLAGSLLPEEMPAWTSYLINARSIQVGYLSQSQVYQLAEQPIPDFSLQYQANARQEIWRLTRGHPALVQLLCHEVVHFKNQQPQAQRFVAEVKDINAASRRAIKNMQMYFEDIFALPGQAFLRQLALLGQEGELRRQDFPQYAGNEVELDDALRLLTRREILRQTSPDSYAFQVELIRGAYELL